MHFSGSWAGPSRSWTSGLPLIPVSHIQAIQFVRKSCWFYLWSPRKRTASYISMATTVIWTFMPTASEQAWNCCFCVCFGPLSSWQPGSSWKSVLGCLALLLRSLQCLSVFSGRARMSPAACTAAGSLSPIPSCCPCDSISYFPMVVLCIMHTDLLPLDTPDGILVHSSLLLCMVSWLVLHLLKSSSISCLMEPAMAKLVNTATSPVTYYCVLSFFFF